MCIDFEQRIEEPGKEVRKYRFLFDQKRGQLIRDAVNKNCGDIDHLLGELQKVYSIDEATMEHAKKIDDPNWLKLRDRVRQIDVLLGNSVPRPPRWSDMQRHLHYSETHDLRDIICSDWPAIKARLTRYLL